MDELKGGAAQCEIEDGEKVELCVGGFLRVLKKSENLDDDDKVDPMIAALGAEEAVEAFAKLELLKSIPKPNPVKQVLKPGPPIGTVVKALATGIKRKNRDDKDAMYTEDAVDILKRKCWMKEEQVLDFMKVFIAFVEEKHGADVSDILCLPE